jgi:hypothetical protein
MRQAAFAALRVGQMASLMAGFVCAVIAGSCSAATLAAPPRQDLCEAIRAAAEQIEKDGHYLTAVTAQLYKEANAARNIGALGKGSGIDEFADAVAKANASQAELSEKVAADNFKVAEALRTVQHRSCPNPGG